MALDFEKLKCKELTKEALFGLCDIENEAHARISTNFEEQNNWICEVVNQDEKEVIFSALDKCIQNNSEKEISLCDVMLSSNGMLYLIELKQRRQNRLGKAFEQLESTLEEYIKYDEKKFYEFMHRKAIYINRKNLKFNVIEKEVKQKFWSNYKTRLSQDAKIIIT
jgi:hypothetical protein